jgi:hypothetical protein
MSSTESSLNPSGTDEWATWSVGTKHYVLTGGPPEIRKYLLKFFSALIVQPPHSASRKVAFGWAVKEHALPRNLLEVLPGVYQVGHDDESAVLTSPGCWTVRIFADEVNVELNQEGWRHHWDVLNQALTTAFVTNSSTWNIISVHAACIETSWGILLLCGSSGAGKSTLALGTTAAGAILISDDRVFVSLDPPLKISTLGSPVTFRAGISHILPTLAKYEDSVDQKILADPLRRHQYKIAVDSTQAFGTLRKFSTQAPTAIVLISRDQQAGHGKWGKLTGEEALLRVRNADPVPIYSSSRDEMLYRLIEQLDIWSFSYAFGDNKHFESTVRRLIGGPRI